MNKTRESHCRICGGRLSYIGVDKKVHWSDVGADDEGLVCDSCMPIAKLERIRSEKKKKEGM